MNRKKRVQPPPERTKLKNVGLFKEERVSNTSPVTTIPISEIVLPKSQPRRYFDPKKLESLTRSIKKYGILEPLLVRSLPDGRYELVAGERRYHSGKSAALSEVPVVIKELSDREAFQLSLIENLQREDLNPLEETEGILELLSLELQNDRSEVVSLLYRMQNLAAGKITDNVISNSKEPITDNVISNPEEGAKTITDNVISKNPIEAVKAIFAEVGRMTWESFIVNRLPLLKLPEDIKQALMKGQIEYTKAKAIARVAELTARKNLLAEAIEQSLSLQQIRQRIKDSRPQKQDNIVTRMESTYKQVKKAKKLLLNNPKKKKQLESLLAQIEKLISDDN